MNPKIKKLLLALSGLMFAAPAWAVPITMLDGVQVSPGKVGMRSDKIEFRSSGGTGLCTDKYVDSTNNSRTYTRPDVGANASYVMTEGTQTINGTKTFSTPPSITGGLPASGIQTGSAKRETQTIMLSPSTGTAANTTVYSGLLSFTKACTVKAISYGTAVDPVSGTNTLKALKGSSSGNTMLSTASVSLNGTTANTVVAATLTATGADLSIPAATPLYFEYSAGTQGAAAKSVFMSVEVEKNDF
ncbi:MAG: hypothetical protein K2X27_15925 [Candidatus Obscuribacterales bacterium]|nr:hypothetical protein [Candidatus Obscuribacterales bacterium]